MHNHDATETAYRNGYEAGKRDAVKHGEWDTTECTEDWVDVETFYHRDKLIELLEKAESAVYWDSSDQSFINKIADHLIANGVTFAENNNMWIFHVVGFEGDSDSYWASSPIDVTVLAESEKEAIKKTEDVTGRKLSGINRNIIVIERAVFELKENA